MARLPHFDYRSPFYYMVTLKRLPGLAAFSLISPDGQLIENELTRAFTQTIQTFHLSWPSCESLSPYIIMPDHIHLLLKIRNIPNRVTLGRLVYPLRRALSEAYWRIVGAGETAPCQTDSSRIPAPIFETEWHDWIVKRKGQLAAFSRYIRENPIRAALRRNHAQFFRPATSTEFLGHHWFAYGNLDLLNLPVLTPLKGHRATPPNSPDWEALLELASRIGPGGAGVSTFMSPLEKACGNALIRAGGSAIVLSPEGFGPRWHPPREQERLCAEGRILYLSRDEALKRQLTRKELYRRCHEMMDLVIAALPPNA